MHAKVDSDDVLLESNENNNNAYTSYQTGNAAPIVSVSHSPQDPTTGNTVTFTANANDQDGYVTSITIYVDNVNKKTCSSSNTNGTINPVTKCQYTGGPYSAGSHNYYAIAVDDLGKTGTSSMNSFTVYSSTNGTI